jgi:hypothetical protein
MPKTAKFFWALGASCFLIAVAAPLSLAQISGPGSRPGSTFYGIVRRVPNSAEGTWIIGGRTINSDRFTIIEQFGEPVNVGSCVEVEFAHRDMARRISAAAWERCR